jgi:thiamine transporter 2/3
MKLTVCSINRATSFVRAAVQGGECLAYVIGQSIISFKWGTYKTLNYISIGCVSSIFFFTLLLPNVSWRNVVTSDCSTSLKSNDAVVFRDRPSDKSSPQTYMQFATYRLKMIWRDFKAIYSNAFVIKWSLWWALATCGLFQVGNYIQTLWGTVQSDSDNSDVYNGITEAVNTALGANMLLLVRAARYVLYQFLGTVTILLMQLVHVNWTKWGELTLAVLSLVDCALLILLSQAQNVWVMYTAYVTYCVLYQMMITIAQ